MRISKSTHLVARFAAVVLSVFLAVAASGGSALAQTDLDGSDLIVTGSGPWNLSYTNSNNSSQSIVAIYNLVNATRYDYTGSFTGNIFIDVTHNGYGNNDNRFTFSNTGNNIQGGVAMHNGILFVSNNNQLVSFSGGLTLDNAVFMAYGACDFNVTIPAGSFGALRASGGAENDNLSISQRITGGGDLIIVPESGKTVTISGANDYTGVTSIGTFRGGSGTGNQKAALILGADNTLPSTTVVEFAKSQNPAYSDTATTTTLNLNGTTQTISGLYGGAAGSTITNGTAAAANLTIDLADGTDLAYSGTIAGNSATNVTNLTVTGAGNQTLSGNISNASITKSGSGTLTLGADSVSLSSLTVNDGTLSFTPNVAMTVSGKVTTPDSSLDLNGANLTYTSNVATDFSNIAITNTNTETQSVLTIAPTADVTQQTFDKKVSGNTRLVVHLKTNQNNDSRLMITNTNSDYTGGLYIEQGTARVDNYGALGTSNQIDMKHGSLMTSLSYEGYTINLVGDASKGERGAIRFSGSSTGNLDAYITGVGSLEIVYDGSITLTNQANDYQGKTYLGNFQWRSTNTSGDATLNLGASGVLPDTTEVVFGKNAEGNGTSGNITLNLKGYNETVAGISGQSTSATITSSTPATLTLIGNGDYTFAGNVTDSVTLEKKGTGTQTIAGANEGTFVVSNGTLKLSGDNSKVQSITVKENGKLVPMGVNALATTVNLEGVTFAYPDNAYIKNTNFVATQGDVFIEVPMTDLQSGTYKRQLFTGTYNNMDYFTNPQYISNVDAIANAAYTNVNNVATFSSDIWGDPNVDQNNTNLMQTTIVNTTGSAIALDFAYKFRNDAYLAITDSQGNKTVVLNWSSTSPTSDAVFKEGSFTFEPGEVYTVETRLTRYNKTIGANGGGLNSAEGTLVGMGARISGTNGEYLPLNFNSDTWIFSDGSLTTSADVSFAASSVAINAGATVTFNTQNNNFDVYSTFSGEGLLFVNPNGGYTHTYSGNIGGSLSLIKYGDGVLVLNSANDMNGTVDIQAGEVVYAQAGAMNLVTGVTIAQNAQMTVNLPASDGAAGISGIAQNYGTITVTNGRFRTWGVSGEGTIVMDGGTLMNLGRTVSGAYSAETIIDNAIVIESGKTGNFNVDWAIDGNYQDSKLQLNGALSGAGDFLLETNVNAPEDIAYIAPLIANFSSSDFTGNVITNSGYNMLVMGKENAFGTAVGTLQNGGNVDMNGYNQTFAGLTGSGNLINRGSTQATLTLNIPEGETSQYDGNIGASISLVKSGNGVLVLNHANDMNGTVDIQAGEVVYAQAGAMNLVTGVTIAQNAQMTVNLPASDGAAGISGIAQNYGTITVTNGRFRTWGVSGEGTIVMDGGTLMNLGRTVSGVNSAETIIDNAIVIECGKTGTFNVGWAIDGNYQDSKLQLNGALSGAGDFILETNHDAPTALSQIAPLVANFSSADFTGNVITSNVISNYNGYNMLKMGKENAFGMSVGTLQNGGNVDMNGYNQTFAGLTGSGNLINRGSTQATLTLNIPEGETSQYDGNIGASISLVKSGNGVLVLNHANDMNGTVDIQVGEVVYAQAGAMNLVSGVTIAQDAQLTVNLPASDGAAGISGVAQNNGTITITNGRFRTWGVSGSGTIVMDGGTLMNLGRTVSGTNYAETIIDNAIVIEEGKTGTFNVGWAKSGHSDSKLQLNGTLSGAGDFILETNHDAPTALSQIAPLVANFSSSDFTGNVITNRGYNMLVMGKENAFGESVGTLQDNGWVDINGYNQTFAGLTGTGNIINRGSADATFTLNVPEEETTKFEGVVYGVANQSDGKSYQNISFVKSGAGTAQFDANVDELYVKNFTIAGGRLDLQEHFNGILNVGVNGASNAGVIFSPGNSIGTLTIDSGALNLASGATLLMEIGGSSVADNDQLLFGSGVTSDFAAGSIIQFVTVDGVSFEQNQSVAVQLPIGLDLSSALWDTGLFSGAYDAVSGIWSGLYAPGGGGGGEGVPEPSTWALLLLGAFGLLYFRKRK